MITSSIPLQEIYNELLTKHQVRLWVKREDLVHPSISGNKWRKLKYNLLEAKRLQKNTLLTFGGAYSNHLYAVAAAGKEFDFQTIGIVRGEEHLPLNETLDFAVRCGMRLHYVDRTTYRHKTSHLFIEDLHKKFGDFYLIPEGGSNAFAVKGCTEILENLEDIDYDYICCACGTGGTLAGIVSGLPENKTAIGFAVLKGADFLYHDVNQLITNYKHTFFSSQNLEFDSTNSKNWSIQLDYHFGGYAKCTKELVEFIEKFEKQTLIPLEYLYTGKMMYGIFELIEKGFFPKNVKIIAIHTGGLRSKNIY
jgi:1-aminocyclopropane-1-carboxylate deaminase/D-cysteine desulfhydrase-like pyridoxal-dependent ACC family enzyme